MYGNRLFLGMFAALLLNVAVPSVQAQDGGASFGHNTFYIAIDRDRDPSTGCAYSRGSRSLVGIDLVLQIEVDATMDPPQVVSHGYMPCGAGSFSSPILLSGGGWPLGFDNGLGGADVLEMFLPLGLLGQTDSFDFWVFSESLAGGSDEMPEAGSLTFVLPAAIPTLGFWALAIFVVLTLFAALVIMRKHKKLGLLSLLGLSAALFLAFTAMGFMVDGDVSDWTGMDPVETDIQGDAGDDGVDLIGIYMGNDEENLYVRIDVADADNQAPDAVDDFAKALEEEPVNIDVLANDSDPDAGDPLNITNVSNPVNGTAVLEANQTITYTSNPNQKGEDSFTYTLTDVAGNTDTATVTVSVTGTNDPPIAVDDSGTVDEGGTLTVAAPGVLDNDTDPDTGNVLTAQLQTNPTNGTVTLNADGSYEYTHDGSETSVDSFVYRAFDGLEESNDATVTITINPINDDPVAVDDAFTVDEDSSDNPLDVIANDSDAEGDTLTITATSVPDQGGSVNIVPGGASLTYSPAPDFFGTETFSYDIEDGNGGSDSATVTITVSNVNDPPGAGDDSFTVDEDSIDNDLDVLANDTINPNVGETLTVTAVGVPDNGGSATIAPGGGSVLYSPAADFFGTETFTYTVEDGNGGSDDATVTVTVNNVNDDPSAVDDSDTVVEDSADNPLDPLANDSFAPDTGETLTITATGATSAGGVVTITGGGTGLEYTPAANFFGDETFTYTIEDGNGGSDTATFTVTVTNVNDDPDAVDDNLSVSEDSTDNVLSVLDNDTDAPDSGETLTITAVGATDQGGTAVIGGGGTNITYTPAASFTGDETFTYTIEDGNGGSDTATVVVTVDNVNDDPTANDDAFNVDEDSTDNALSPLDNDSILPDVGETLTITAVGATSDGGVVTIVAAGASLEYTPAADFFGDETFTYDISDGNGGSDTGTITVTVDNVNDDPTAVDDSDTVAEDSADNALDPLANDSFAPDTGETLTITATGATSDGGTVNIVGGGTGLEYSPAADFFGDETFTYTIEDGNGGSDTATFTVTVTNVNDDPDAVDDSLSVDEDSTDNALSVLDNDTDAPDSGETLTITAVGATDQGGTAVIGGGGTSITYTPAASFTGDETFTYTIEDGNGGSDTATVTVTVDNVNDDPTANDDSYSVNEDSSNNALSPLDNDSILPDVGETLTITATGATSDGGTVNIVGGGTSLEYTPAADFFGDETFTYDISDGNGGSDTGTITVTVNNVNDDPTANDDSDTVVEDSVNNALDPLANDSIAPDSGETLTITATGATSDGGTVNITGGGTGLDYTPAADFFGDETFTYTIEDGNGGSDTATFTVTVTNVNDDPTAVDDTDTVVEDSSNNVIDVLANDLITPDSGETLTITGVGATDNGGTALINGGGTSIDYTPAADFFGDETFTYTIEDGNGGSDTATVTVTVTNTNDPPDAQDDAFAVSEDSVDNSLDVLANDGFSPNAGEILTITATGATSDGGTVNIVGGGTSLDYTPAADFFGDETFTYTIEDGNGGSDTATVTVTVNNTNDNPDAVDDTDTVAEDSVNNSLDVLANDTDAPDTGETLTITATGATSDGGTVNIVGGGTSLEYSPAADFFGDETFTYTIEDGNGGSDTATVTVTVTNVNDDPTAVDDTDTVVQDTVDNPLDVLANDLITPDVGETLTITATGAPDNGGSVNIVGGGTSLEYSPAAAFVGDETFTYTIEDGNGGSDTGSVTVTVTSANTDPVANDDTDTVNEDSTDNIIDVLANDTDPDMDVLSVSAVGVPDMGGSASITAGGGSVTYSPAAAFVGDETFTYTVSDGNGGTDTATVTITVDALPMGADDAYNAHGNTRYSISAGDGVLGNDNDPEMAGLTVDTAAMPDVTADGGTIDIAADGSFTYTPPAGKDISDTDTYIYTVVDAEGGTDTATITFTFTDVVWFVDNTAGGGGTGFSHLPFETLADAEAAATANERIFVFEGTGDSTNMSDGITLLAGQRLVGEPLGHSVDIDGMGNLVTIVAAGNRPVITNTAGDVVTLADGVLIEELTLEPQASAAVAGDGDATLRSLTININSATSSGVELPAYTGALVMTDVTMTGFAGADSGFGVDVDCPDPGASFDFNNVDISGVNTAMSFVDASHTIPLDDCDLTDNEGLAVELTGSGDLVFTNSPISQSTGGLLLDISLITASSSLTFDTNSPLSMDNPGAVLPAISIDAGNVDFDMTFEDVTIDATGGGDGVLLANFGAGSVVDFNGATNISAADGDGLDIDGIEGTFTFDDLLIMSTLGDGILLSNSAAAVTFTLDGTTGITNSSGQSVDLSNLTDGSVTFDGAGGDINDTGAGISISGVNSGTSASVTFNNALTLNTATDNAVTLTNNADGVFSFAGGLDIDTTTGTGFSATNGGTLSLTGTNTLNVGTGATNAIALDGVSLAAAGMTFANITAAGNTTSTGVSINNVSNNTFTAGTITLPGADTNDGISIANSSANFSLTSVTVDNTADDGIFLNANTGTVTVSGGTVGATNDADGNAVEIFGGGANVTIAAALTNGSNPSVLVASRSGGSVSFSGNIVDNGTGIRLSNNTGGSTTFSATTKTINSGANNGVDLSNNTGHTVNFTGGGLAITTSGTGIGFEATGGGTVNVTGGSNTIDTTAGTGQGIVMTSTSIGGSNLIFERVDTDGASNGIALTATGASGGLMVTGDGSNGGSGDTIHNSTGNGVSLIDTDLVSLSFMNIQNGAVCGINGNTVVGLALDTLVIQSNGDAVNEAGCFFTELTGTVTVTDTTITDSAENNWEVTNTGGTLNLTVTDSSFTSPSVALGNDNFQVVSNTTATINATISGSTFTGAFANGLTLFANNSASLTAEVIGGTYQNNNVGINCGANSTADISFCIRDITTQMTSKVLGSHLINITNDSSGTLRATVKNCSNIDGTNQTGTGSTGIRVVLDGVGGIIPQGEVLLENNTISNTDGNGIVVDTRDSTAASVLHAVVRDNTISMKTGISSDGIQVRSQDSNTINTIISGNAVSGAGGWTGQHIRVRESGTSFFNIEQVLAGLADPIATVLATNNPACSTFDVSGTVHTVVANGTTTDNDVCP